MIDKLIINENYDTFQLIKNYIELALMLEEPQIVDKLEKKIKGLKKLEISDEDVCYAIDEMIAKDEKALAKEKRKRSYIHLSMASLLRQWNECLSDLSIIEINDLQKALNYSIEKNKEIINECSLFEKWSKTKSHQSTEEDYKDEYYFNIIYEMFKEKSKKAKIENKLYNEFVQRIEEYKREIYEKKFTDEM